MTFCYARQERVKETRYCETKNCEINVWELDREQSKNCGKIAKEQIAITFIIIYLWTLLYIGIKSHKTEHTFKTHD